MFPFSARVAETYRVHALSKEEVAETISRELAAAGVPAVKHVETAKIRLEGGGAVSGLSSILSRSLYRISIVIKGSESGAQFTIDHRRSGPCRVVSVTCFVLAVALIAFITRPAFIDWIRETGQLLTAIPAVAGAVMLPSLGWELLTRDSVAAESLKRRVRSALLVEGGTMIRDFGASSSREQLRMRWILIYVMIVLALLLRWMLTNPSSLLQPSWIHGLVAIGAVLILCLGFIVKDAIRVSGLDWRVSLALTGVTSSISMAILLVSSMHGFLLLESRTLLEHAVTAQDWALQNAASFRQRPIEERDPAIDLALETLGKVRVRCLVSWTPPLIALVMCAVIWIRHLASLHETAERSLVMNRRWTADADLTHSVTGSGYLPLLRLYLTGYWICASALIAILILVLGTITLAALSYPVRARGAPWPRDVVSTSILAAELSLQTPSESQWCERVVRTYWIIVFGVAVGCVVTSTVLLWSARTRRKHALSRLTQAAEESFPDARVLEVVSRLGSKVGLTRVGTVVTEHQVSGACLHCFGLLQPRYVIEVSRSCVSLLEKDECEALLAHELAHALLGHARRHVILHYLGRATLVGGGFVGVLEDSFGNELAADRAAVEKLAIPPQSLVHALSKLAAIEEVERLRCERAVLRSPLFGLPSHVSATPQSVDLVEGWFGRIQQMVRLWIQMYCYEQATPYWHPLLSERIEALRELDGMENR